MAEHALKGGSPTPIPISREDFMDRFKRRLRDILGESYDYKYVDEIAPTYWNDAELRTEGPEECAEFEASEWGIP